MVFNTDYRTEKYVLRTEWDDFPNEIKERATMCAIDLCGALILGSYGEQFAAGERLAKMMNLNGDVSVVGSKNKYNLLGAAIAMGHASNSFDIDDGYNMIKGHPGTSFIGGMLAAAIEKKISYREFLTTLIVCYETTIRWALAMQDHYGFLHSTGAYGAFGTALGIGRVYGFDEKQLNNALSVADFHAPMVPVMRAVEYPSMNKDGVPFGALVGTMAALETLCGTTGKTHILELPEYEAYLNSLGEKYYVKDLYFKPFTCCRWAHQPILACQTLMKSHGFSHEDVASVKVNTFSSAAKLSKIRPADTDEAQYNIAFPVASALVYRDVGYQQIRNEALHDPRVLEMMDKLSFEVDPAMDARFPEERLAWVEIALKDGKVYQSEIYAAPGEHTDPALGTDWICKKFKRVTRPMLEAQDQDEMLRLLRVPSDEMTMDVLVGKLNSLLKSKDAI